MKARARTALGSLALLAALAAAVAAAYFLVERPRQAEWERGEAEARLLPFDPAAAREIEVESGGSRMRLLRVEGGWRVASPPEGPADAGRVTALLERLSSLRSLSRVAAPGAGGLAAYGLEPPRSRLSVRLEGGRTETLALGEPTRFDGSLYVQPTSGAVERVSAEARLGLAAGLETLRAKPESGKPPAAAPGPAPAGPVVPAPAAPPRGG